MSGPACWDPPDGVTGTISSKVADPGPDHQQAFKHQERGNNHNPLVLPSAHERRPDMTPLYLHPAVIPRFRPHIRPPLPGLVFHPPCFQSCHYHLFLDKIVLKIPTFAALHCNQQIKINQTAPHSPDLAVSPGPYQKHVPTSSLLEPAITGYNQFR